jgi:CheY-like chemotaxis protein
METKERQKILVVEDEAIVAKDLQMRLINLGYDVPVTVPTGELAIAKAGEMHPDMILMDISLRSAMLGTEAAATIHKMYDIPVIFLTAYSDEQTLENAKASEPMGYITKPIEKNDLRVTLEMAFYKAEMEAERRTLMRKLQEAMDEIKTLSGIIPICASCKKIRNDAGYWEAVEEYIEHHSDAQFSHGVCPECAAKLYPELNGKLDYMPDC